jgi:hypothetical protein
MINDDLIGLLGQFCFELLGDQRFAALEKMFGQQMAVDILNTAPQEVKKREGIHAAYTGFLEFKALMHDFAKTHEELLRAEQQALNPAPMDDPTVHDIY